MKAMSAEVKNYRELSLGVPNTEGHSLNVLLRYTLPAFRVLLGAAGAGTGESLRGRSSGRKTGTHHVHGWVESAERGSGVFSGMEERAALGRHQVPYGVQPGGPSMRRAQR
jgi:hypothetical protein